MIAKTQKLGTTDYQAFCQLYIDGQFVDAESKATLASINPYDHSVLTEFAMGDKADVDKAVHAAQKAFPAWSGLPAADRGKILLKLADLIEQNAQELATIESLDTGHPLRDSLGIDVPRTAATFRYFGGMADKFQGEQIPVEAGFLNFTYREPVGVVGQVVPWNFPLMFTSWKMAPALAAGNCIVLKPSELTPLTTLKIAHLMTQAGLPKGVVNIIPGYGHSVGQYLAEHSGVAKIAFTGSTGTGRKIVQASAGNLKKVQLELGGKGANIVFADANLKASVNGSAWSIFHNQGQACIAGSRLLLHHTIADAFLDEFVKLAKSIRLGNPLALTTEMGPLTSSHHRDRIFQYVDIGLAEGGKILYGGTVPEDPELSKGYFIKPTVMEATSASQRIAQEEIFGPFVTVLRFNDDEEALHIANSTEYGLGGGLWTNQLQRAHKFAKDLKSGMVWINCYKRVNPGSPFGGVGLSGYGREMGFDAMREYTQVKSVWVNVDAQIPPYYVR
ncbi:MAG: aldehyde dehydrogenase family protein [Gammaproteobacteria bacterium]|nr:aldehyde dehydrogenase family protein [Gammaproteobacteria bacterium]